MNPRSLLSILALFVCALAHGQKNAAYIQYIEKYKDAAIEQMRQHRIPASITLAQALLESGAGRSYLATKANNHFGIKVGGNWNGPYVKRDDDRKDDRFRKYKNVEESYEDHSLFLQQTRYKRLFDLNPRDYKAWARGLKACGYATSPTYADQLIKIIETYQLHEYDSDTRNGRYRRTEKEQRGAHGRLSVETVNGLRCVEALPGETWDALAKRLGTRKRKLLKWNETPETLSPAACGHVFLEKKARKAAPQYKGEWHKVQVGESMHAISQHYGIRLKNLYKMNHKNNTYVPAAGDLLKLR